MTILSVFLDASDIEVESKCGETLRDAYWKRHFLTYIVCIP